MKKMVWLLSLVLYLATFFISPSALADTTSYCFTQQEVDEFKVQGAQLVNGKSVNHKAWTLSNGTGARTFIAHVDFPEPYQQPPVVVLSLSGYKQKGLTDRLTVQPIRIKKNGFDVKYRTWGDSQVKKVFVNWTAFGGQ